MKTPERDSRRVCGNSTRDKGDASPGDRLRETRVRPAQPALGEFNRLFHDLYTARADDRLRELESGDTPVVVRMDDRLILQWQGRDLEYEITGEPYHELKAASHIPAVVFLALTDTERSTDRLAALEAGLDGLPAFDQGADAIAGITRALLEQVRSSRPSDVHEALSGYRSAVRSALQTMAREAAGMEIEALDRAMRDIEARLECNRLQQTYFVVCAGHQPRYKQLSKMYFRHWLVDAGWPESRVAHHIVYAEGKASLKEALELVRTRIIDGQLAAALFGDLASLDEDVLGDAALEQLARRFGRATHAASRPADSA